jgi:peptidoglycan/xylan/chitin deacetylase (PgdA/CDA1 family)
MLIEAAGVLAVSGVGALLTGLRPNSSLFGQVVREGDRGPFIYLTFDDGPNSECTERILQTLDTLSVPAAFFMIGDAVRRLPPVARAVSEQGHDLGNHTQSHPNLVLQRASGIRREIDDAHRSIVEETGRTPRMFRPPYGQQTPAVRRALRPWSYVTFGWRMSARDFERPGVEVIRRRLRSRLRPGAIVLLHDGDPRDLRGDRSQTASALPGIVRDAREAGFAFRPLRELLERPVAATPHPLSGRPTSGS